MVKVNICRSALFPPILLILFVFGGFSLFAVDGVASVVSVVSYRHLIPEPVSVVEKEGAPFVVNERTKVVYSGNNPEWKSVAELLATYLSESTGYPLTVGKAKKLLRSNEIIFERNLRLPKEGFQLEVTEDNMMIGAADLAGAFYAVQMLRQLLLSRWEKSAEQEQGNCIKQGESITRRNGIIRGKEIGIEIGEVTVTGKELSFPPVVLKDYPSMSYRGAMLDVSRHFFSVAQVKRYIDLLAFHRLNHFHWHLTDDQGWRIEIKKYPNLTKVGAWRGPDKYGGYYTQEDIKEIVAYAAERCITIIPEIDMPGHTQAALAAYPELGCTGKTYEVATEVGGVHKDVMCVGNDFTLPFVKDVLKEVADLFPGAFIHIGGDEVPKDRWKQCNACQKAITKHGLKDVGQHTAEEFLQSAFNEEIAAYLRGLGKRMIGWDEVLSDSLSREVTIMSWRGLGRATAALRKGHSVIVSADSHLYLNHYQTINSEQEPRATGGLVEMKKVFETPFFSPQLSTAEKKRVLGAEACLWTSFIDNDSLLDYMLLPRLAAFAEAAWCEGRRGTYNHFLHRLPALLNGYNRLGYDYANHFFTISATYQSVPEERNLQISLESLPDTEIYYTLDGSQPSKSTSAIYQSTLRIDKSCVLKAVSYLSNGLPSDEFRKEILVNKATFRPVRLLNTPSERYQGKNGKVLVDGIRSINFHNTGLWVGHHSSDLSVVIDLESLQLVSSVEVSALTDLSAWIMGPQFISVFVSPDGEKFELVSRHVYDAPTDAMGEKQSDLNRLSFETMSARYVKVVAEPFKSLPKGHSGENEPPFLFVDEIRIH